MTIWICKTCGAQHAPSDRPPGHCAICDDERQYVGANGQEWIDRESISTTHANDWRDIEPDLTGIGLAPTIGIGQRALLVQTPEGNVLWDCVPMVDGKTGRPHQGAGRHQGDAVLASAFLHRHGRMERGAWAACRSACRRRICRNVMRPSPWIEPWDGDVLDVLPDITVHRLGGHFTGSSVLEWAPALMAEGAILVGDTIQVAPDPHWVSFMRSYPNMIPLPAREVRRIADRAAALTFDRIYGGWWDRVVMKGAKQVVARSARAVHQGAGVGLHHSVTGREDQAARSATTASSTGKPLSVTRRLPLGRVSTKP